MQVRKSITTNLWVFVSPSCTHNLIPLPKSSQTKINAHPSTANHILKLPASNLIVFREKIKSHLNLKIKPLECNSVLFDAVC